MTQQPVIIDTKIRIDKNPIGIPPGTFIGMKIRVLDEWAEIFTSNPKFTKDLVRTAKPGEEAKFIERTQKTLVHYPGKSQREITVDISKSLGLLPKGE